MDDVQFEVVGVDTRLWGEQGGSYSSDGLYRWSYERPIGAGPLICWIGLNPGTGDREGRYRPTLQRMVDRSRARGFGRFCLVNLFGWRTTKPAELRAAARLGHDVVGDGCDDAILDGARRAALVVAAWGVHGRLLDRDSRVLSMLGEVHCLGRTASEAPRHPLYVPLSTEFERLQ
jgi:hypothetical protein